MDALLAKTANRLTRIAYWQLLWERYTPVLALGALGAALFIIGSLSGLWQRIGDPWRLIALIIAVGFLIRSFARARAAPKPTQSNARRRVELDNNLSHRPLDTITDAPAIGAHTDPAWQIHLQRARQKLQSAAPPRLRPALAPIDKYFLRYAAPCLLGLAIFIGYGDNYERLRSSISPVWQSGISAKQASYEAWVDPPQYTGRPPSYFKQSNTISAPENSEFVARISGVKSAPRLIIKEQGRTRRITAKRLGPKSFEARVFVLKTATARFRIGKQVQSWTLNINKDTPPIVEFAAPPEAGKHDKLVFKYNVKDDIGVEALSLSIALKSAPQIKERISIDLPGTSVRSALKEVASLDLTKHKWAEKEIIGTLIAMDGKGQSTTSQSKEFVIPGKVFVEPLAKAIAEQRLLMLAGTNEYPPLKPTKNISIADLEKRPMFAVDRPKKTIERAPQSVQRTARLIEIITDQPAGMFDDPSVYMGLRNIYRRLQIAHDQSGLLGVPEDLWSIAMRAEFGLLGDALADMRAAQRALNNAMARRAPQREIDVLFDRYNLAVDRYMEELMKKAIEEAKNQEGNDGSGGNGIDIQSNQIQELLDAIEEANRVGDTLAARKALAQLAQLLEKLKIKLAQGGGSGNGPSDDAMSEELKKALEELNDILGEQRKLRDETQSAGRADSDTNNGQPDSSAKPGQGAPKSAEQLADQQNALSEMLSSLEKNAGKSNGKPDGKGSADEKKGDEAGGGSIQQALKNAKSAMSESQEALANKQFYKAGRAQSDAIDALRKVGEGLLGEQAKRIKDGADKSANSEGSDPFGRENEGNGVDDIDISGIDDQKKARELLEKLRKRSGEQEREQIERDYLDRLLERF